MRNTRIDKQFLVQRTGSVDLLRENILWHVDPLLGNDRETSNKTMAVTRQPPVNSNSETVFSVRYVPR
jgi:hypothetical protein